MKYPTISVAISISLILVGIAFNAQHASGASTTILRENFDTENDMGIFSQTSIASNFNWRWLQNDFDGKFIEMNGFNADAPSDDWLILTDPVDLSPFANPTLNFKFITRFGGPDIDVLVSQDYDAAVHADPTDATWTPLSYFTEGELNEPNHDSWDAQFSDTISLADHIGTSVSIAFHYVSEGSASGEAAVWRIDEFVIGDQDPDSIILNSELGFEIDPFTSVDEAGFEDWQNNSVGGRSGAFLNASLDMEYNEDWLISPPMEIAATDIPVVSFDYYTDFEGPDLKVLVSTDYDSGAHSSPNEATWVDLQVDFSTRETDSWSSYSALSIFGFSGDNVRIAFVATSDISGEVAGKLQGISNFCAFKVDTVPELSATVTTPLPQPTTGQSVPFVASVSGGKWPFIYAWEFGDGQTSTDAAPSHEYENAGSYTVKLTTTDAAGTDHVFEAASFINVLNADNVFVKRNFEGSVDSPIPDPWTAFSESSDIDWHIDQAASRRGAFTRGFGADEASTDWLISPMMTITSDDIPVLSFDVYSSFTGPLLQVLVSTDYNPSDNGIDPTEATWKSLGVDLSTIPDNAWTAVSDVSLAGFSGNVYVAFKYVSTGTVDGAGRTYGIDEVQVIKADAVPPLAPVSITASTNSSTTDQGVAFTAFATGGTHPYTYLWNFGDGMTSTDPAPLHTYATPGAFTASLTVMDALGSQQSATAGDSVTVIDASSILLNIDIAGEDNELVESPWFNYSTLSSADWAYATFDGQQGAFINGFGADEESDDWLISPSFTIAAGEQGLLSFDLYSFFSGGGFEVLVSPDYVSGSDPATATWIPIEADFNVDDWGSVSDVAIATVGTLNIAFHYTSTGTGGGDGRRIGIDNVQIFKTDAPVDETILFQYDFAGIAETPIVAPWTAVSQASNADWQINTRGDRSAAVVNGIGADGASIDWLISPAIDVSTASFPTLSFDYYTRFLGPDLEVLVSTDYDPAVNMDPDTATWASLFIDLATATEGAWTAIDPVSLLGVSDTTLSIAFKYSSTGEDSGQGKEIGIDAFKVYKAESANPLSAEFAVSTGNATTDDMISFSPVANGGTRPYTFTWNFGDGTTTSDPHAMHQYTAAGTFSVGLTVKDAAGAEVSTDMTDLITVVDAALVLVRKDFGGADDSIIQQPWTSYSATSAAVWQLDTYDGQQGAFMNGFGTDDISDDWLISPSFAIAPDEIGVLSLDFYTLFSGGTFRILVSTDYDPENDDDPTSATWSAVEADLGGSAWGTLSGIEITGISGSSVYLAFHYTSDGVESGESRRIGIDNVQILRAPAPEDALVITSIDFAGTEGDPIPAPWTSVSVASNADWQLGVRSDRTGALANGFGADGPGEDWLISPAMSILATEFPELSFDLYTRFDGPPLRVLISTNYNATTHSDPNDATWTDLAIDLSQAAENAWSSIAGTSIAGVSGDGVHLAFKYTTNGPESGQSKTIGIDNVKIERKEAASALQATLASSTTESLTGASINFEAYGNGGVRPYAFAWSFGDGAGGSAVQSPAYTYSAGGQFEATLTLTDQAGTEANASITINVINPDDFLFITDFAGTDDAAIPAPWTTFSVASSADWQIGTFSSVQGAFANGFGADVASDDWLISPPFSIGFATESTLSFNYYQSFSGPDLEALISGTYDPASDADPTGAHWTKANVDFSAAIDSGWARLSIDLSAFSGNNCYLAFRYTSAGTEGGDGKRIGIDDVRLLSIIRDTPAPDTLSFTDWKAWNSYFKPGDPAGDPMADPDGDGLNNAIEHRFDLNPLGADDFGNLPKVQRSGDALTLNYTRMSDGDTLWKAQYSSDLLTWTDAVEGTDVDTVLSASGQPGDVLQNVTIALKKAADSPFLYWRVAIPTE